MPEQGGGGSDTNKVMESKLARLRITNQVRASVGWGGRASNSPTPSQLKSSGAETMVKPPNPLATSSAESLAPSSAAEESSTNG